VQAAEPFQLRRLQHWSRSAHLLVSKPTFSAICWQHALVSSLGAAALATKTFFTCVSHAASEAALVGAEVLAGVLTGALAATVAGVLVGATVTGVGGSFFSSGREAQLMNAAQQATRAVAINAR
jgi:hypothetical protein